MVSPSFCYLRSYCIDCVADLFKADKTLADTAPAFRPGSPRVRTIISAHYTTAPPLVLPPEPPPSEKSSWKVPEISTTASLATRPREYPCTPSKYTTTDVFIFLLLCTPAYY